MAPSKIQLLSPSLKTAYEYLFFVEPDPSLPQAQQDADLDRLKVNKLRILEQVVECLSDAPEHSALVQIRQTLIDTGGVPSLDFCIQTLDFPHALTPPIALPSFSDAWSGTLKAVHSARVKTMSTELASMATEVASGAVDPRAIKARLDTISESLTSSGDTPEELSIEKIYEERLNTFVGPYTGIPELDNEIQGIEPGTVLTFMGFVGSYKTTFGTNLLHRAVCDGLNGLFITFEVDKKIIYTHLLSRHSIEPQFRKDSLMDKESILKCTLAQGQRDHLKDLEKDLRTPPRGRFQILDRADFPEFDKQGIRRKILSLGFKPDFVIFDYIQLTKFYGDDLVIKLKLNPINYYVRVFAELGLDLDGHGHKMAVILLSQANREGWKDAVEAGGEYTLAALADANELERTSYYVVSSFVDQFLKDSNEAKFQLLKHRGGNTIQEPFLVQVRPEFAAMGEGAQAKAMSFGDNMDSFFNNLGSINNDWSLV